MFLASDICRTRGSPNSDVLFNTSRSPKRKSKQKTSESFGVIAVNFTPSGWKYLLVCRRDSVGMCDLLFGNGDINKTYLRRICSQITQREVECILKHPIEKIYHHVFGSTQHDVTSCKQKRRLAWRKNMIKRRFAYIRKNRDLRDIVASVRSQWKDPGWGFPKGRRMFPKEDKFECAIREFEEETGIKRSEIEMGPDTSTARFVEEYVGSNNIIYRHSYFVVVVPSKITPHCDPESIGQKFEISEVAWFPFDCAMRTIRHTNTTKLACLTAAHEHLLSSHPPPSVGSGGDLSIDVGSDLVKNRRTCLAV